MKIRLKAILFAFSLILTPVLARATTAPIVLNIDYTCGDAAIHIGSVMTVYMSAILPTQTINNVSVTASTTTSITLGSTDLTTLPASIVYITDGIRAWSVLFTGSGAGTVTFDDSNLILPQAPFTGSNYSSLINNSFRMYTGNLVNSSTGGGPQMSVDMGNFGSVSLNDNGVSGDLFPTDGTWTGVYNVPVLGFAVYGGRLFGQSIVSNTVASNSPFQSFASFSLDGILADISSVAFNTNKTNYKGLLYLSSISQVSQVPEPTNDQGRFDITVNKTGTIADIVISGTGESGITITPRHLTSIVVPTNSTTTNGSKIWDGKDGAGNYVEDGYYTASLYIEDQNGVAGITRTVRVGVVSATLSIKNVSLSPAGLPSQPVFTDSVITKVSYDVVLANDGLKSIDNSMKVLGWPGGSYNNYVASDDSYSDFDHSVWCEPLLEFLDPSGNVVIQFPGHDEDPGSDTDGGYWLRQFHDAGILVPACSKPPILVKSGDSGIGVTNNAAAQVFKGDGNNANDYDDVVPFYPTNVSAPTQLTASLYTLFIGATPPSGNYRLRIRAILTGVHAGRVGDVPTVANFPDPCIPGSTADIYAATSEHFAPDSEAEILNGPYEGLGIYAEDTSVVFGVSTVAPPVGDTTPPFLVTSSPQDGSTQVLPSDYGPGKPLSAEVQDNETPINTAATTTYIQLVNPQGGFVAGAAATDGSGPNNTATLYFTPSSNLSGGTYTLKVFACNRSNLCIEKDIAFTVQDQTAPDANPIQIVSTSQVNPITLTQFQTGPDGPYSNVTDVIATLSIPNQSANTIDWDGSSISLNQIGAGGSLNVPMTRTLPVIGTTPSNNQLQYHITSPITGQGLYQIVIQAKSKDASGNSFSGPNSVGYVNPEFNTVVNVNSLSLFYPLSAGHLAVSGNQPLTVVAPLVSAGYTPLSSNTQVLVPNFSSLPVNTGYTALTMGAANAYALQFDFNSTGANTAKSSWTYTTAPLTFMLYYNTSDLPLSLQTLTTPLTLFGYNGVSWEAIPSSQYSSQLQNVTDNAYTINVSSGISVDSVYALFYANSIVSGGSPVPTTVPYSFPSTRSFNPTHSNPVFRQARIFYSSLPPSQVEVKIYDTAGGLIRSLDLNRDASHFGMKTDSGNTQYYFTWDGENDSGAIARNGVYLIRYKATHIDSSVDTQTRLVALIR